MKICVLNGSPKGKYSVTLQTSLYLQKLYVQHDFTFLNVGQRIHALEKDFSEAANAILDADLLLFSYPVYTFLAPSQLHRFIELLKASGIDLSGKYATQISTSKHFYDVTAHRYIEDNCADLGLNVIHGLSADMDDLLCAQCRKDAVAFMDYISFCVQNGICEPHTPNSSRTLNPYTVSLPETHKKAGYDTVIVADLKSDDERLANMIEDFRNAYEYPVRIINIREYPFSGGCLGCFKCASDGKCVYKDGFDTFLREQIQSANAVVFAFSISDHSMGARFKMYDDRQFCNGHRTVTEGAAFGYIVSGDYENESNLRTVIEARSQVGHTFLSGVGYTPQTIAAMAKQLAYALENNYLPPRNFYGVSGMKIFRDLIWQMRGLMKADHVFYKKHGIYDDFPQKSRGKMLKMCLFGSLVRNPKISAKMGNRMNEGMIAPYRKVIEALESKTSKQSK